MNEIGAEPIGRRRPRLERDREARRVAIDRHQTGGRRLRGPRVDAREQQRRAAAVGIGDVHVAEREPGLRPRAAVGADPSRLAGAQPSAVDPIGDDVGDRRVEQREQIARRREQAECVDW